jgi:hypothetical protein
MATKSTASIIHNDFRIFQLSRGVLVEDEPKHLEFFVWADSDRPHHACQQQWRVPRVLFYWDDHHLSQLDLGGDKRIYQHLSDPWGA